MTDLMEMAETAVALAGQLESEWATAERKIADLSQMRSRLIVILAAAVVIPHKEVAQIGADIGKISEAAPSIIPKCMGAVPLSVAAQEWRAVAIQSADSFAEGFDSVTMAKGSREWEGRGSEAYDHYVTKCQFVAEGLSTLLKNAASAMQRADDDIHNWFVGALVMIIPAAVAVVEAVKNLIALVSGLLAYLEALAALGVAGEVAAAVTAAAALEAAGAEILAAAIGAAATAAVAWAAIAGLTLWVQSIVDGAADKILAVSDELQNSTQWPVPGSGVLSAAQW